MEQFPDDMTFESRLVREHWDELLENKLPQIARKMNCTVEQINAAIARMSKLERYTVRLVDTNMPRLRVNSFYARMARDRKLDQQTREFLLQNIRSAQWFMGAIEQRKNTLLRVAQVVVDHQREFFDKGKLHLKPLPMSVVAEAVGVHIATVSRAVAGKYIQSPQGILPLRSLFNGGMETEDGQQHEIRRKLAEAGVGNIARRTVAKYRKILNIPTARFRKKF